MVDIYLDMRRDRLIAEAQAAYDSLRIEMDRASEGLAQAMAEKTTFETENTLVLDLQKEQYSLPQWAGLRTDLVNLEAQVAGLTATLEVVGRQLGTGGGASGIRSSATFETLNQRRDSLAGQVAAAESSRQVKQAAFNELNDRMERIPELEGTLAGL